jgi:uncharacterized Tic20 family protein
MEQTPPIVSVPQATPSGNDKIWSLLCHLSCMIGVGILLPLIVYLAMKGESDYVRGNAREALNFHISVLIYCICCIPLVFIIIGIPMLIIIGIVSFILAIVAAVKAADGGCYRYPLTLRLVS